MAVIRLIIFVAVLGGLMLLLAQNWSPALPLVFLGLRTRPISLAIWMLLSTAAGVFSSLLMVSLVQLSSRSNVRQRQTKSYEPLDPPRVDNRTSRKNEFPEQERKYTYNNSPRPSSQQPREDFEVNDDDWDLDRNTSDDWDFEEREYARNNYDSGYTKIQDDRDDDNFQETEDDYDSVDSSYSYDKSDNKGSNAGKTESVYDADYRVIVPPPSPSKTPETSDNFDSFDSKEKEKDDDWGFLDEDFSEDKSPRK